MNDLTESLTQYLKEHLETPKLSPQTSPVKQFERLTQQLQAEVDELT